MKKKKNTKSWFYKALPFDKKIVESVLILVIVVNFMISGFLFFKTQESNKEISASVQSFQSRVANTKSQ